MSDSGAIRSRPQALSHEAVSRIRITLFENLTCFARGPSARCHVAVISLYGAGVPLYAVPGECRAPGTGSLHPVTDLK